MKSNPFCCQRVFLHSMLSSQQYPGAGPTNTYFSALWLSALHTYTSRKVQSSFFYDSCLSPKKPVQHQCQHQTTNLKHHINAVTVESVLENVHMWYTQYTYISLFFSVSDKDCVLYTLFSVCVCVCMCACLYMHAPHVHLTWNEYYSTVLTLISVHICIKQMHMHACMAYQDDSWITV